MSTPPRHYFLNEGHELAHAEKKGGGGTPKFGAINWGQRGQLLSRSLTSARTALVRSPDPTVADRLFLLAEPVATVPKVSSDKKKHPTGKFDAKPSFAGQDSLVFRRLGMDLVDVGPGGDAIVHVTNQHLEKLLKTTTGLAQEGIREQARWVALERFDVVPIHRKVDASFLASIEKDKVAECVVRLHAMLTRLEVEKVLSALRAGVLGEGESVVRVGRGYSGAPWCLAQLRRRTVERIARDFPSIQAIHPPLFTLVDAAAKQVKKTVPVSTQAAPASTSLPLVAVLDCGIPTNHQLLGPYVRGRVSGRNSGPLPVDHASLVASRLVFGEVDFHAGIGTPPPGKVGIVDVAVADASRSNSQGVAIADDDVVDALGAVLSGNPEVRVFNLSFSGPPLSRLEPVDQAQRLIHAQDLDNFIFANDVMVVMSAGNSPALVQPITPYPDHADDPNWEMGGWVAGINTIKCGAFVGHPIPSGIVNTVGWPSPFSRAGPPRSGAAAPEFSATGGDVGQNYARVPGSGVWCCDSTSDWVDVVGTSFSAPLLAREAALTFDTLRKIAGRPFAALVRAVMTLTAQRQGDASFTKNVRKLADRTLGRGFPRASTLTKPTNDRAAVFWQGVLEGAGDIARVQLPIPKTWLDQAGKPRIRLIVSWDPPVNHAATEIWACRDVTVKLKPSPNKDALSAAKNPRHGNSPLIDRIYALSSESLKEKAVTVPPEFWVVELFYEQIAAYPLGITVGPQQRVAFVAELVDEDDQPKSPHDDIQKTRLSQSMTQLSALHLPLPATLLVTVK